MSRGGPQCSPAGPCCTAWVSAAALSSAEPKKGGLVNLRFITFLDFHHFSSTVADHCPKQEGIL